MADKFPYEVGSRVKLIFAPEDSPAYKMIGQYGIVKRIAPLQPYLADVTFESTEYEGQLIVCDGEMLEPAESPKAAEPEELPEMDVNRDATEEDRAAAYKFMRDCEELLPDRKNLLTMIEKLRLEQLIRERQWNTRVTPAPDGKQAFLLETARRVLCAFTEGRNPTEVQLDKLSAAIAAIDNNFHVAPDPKPHRFRPDTKFDCMDCDRPINDAIHVGEPLVDEAPASTAAENRWYRRACELEQRVRSLEMKLENANFKAAPDPKVEEIRKWVNDLSSRVPLYQAQSAFLTAKALPALNYLLSKLDGKEPK